ncbi:MAG: acetate uptake transporter family protein, partial [Blastocatellia bacterium]
MYRPGKVKGIATPIPLGLAAFGATTFLIGFGVIFEAQAAWTPYFAQALMFGGLAEFLAGIWSFAYGDALAATMFSFVGVFYGWIALSHMSFIASAHGAAPAFGLLSVSTAMVFVVTGFVMLYLWFASFSQSATFNATLATFFIALELFAISFFTGVAIIGLIGGIFALISGLCAFYGSFAEVYNAAAMEEVVPIGEPLAIRERSEHYEYERLRRLHPHAETTN